MTHDFDFTCFKTEINLTQYAASHGYEIDKRKSTRHSIAMRKENSDKVIISRKNGIWVYFSVYDDSDKGSIIDFIQRRTGKSMREIGLELQDWLNGYMSVPNVISYVRKVDEHSPDPHRIKRVFNLCSPACRHVYLQSRGISDKVLLSPRFKGTVFQDKYGNAVFPQFKDGQICALELKNKDKGVFVRGSEKTYWRSNVFPSDHTLVIAEAPIDAISYQILFSLSDAFYIATSGGFSPLQTEMIKEVILGDNKLQNIIIAMDNNEVGERLAERIMSVIGETEFQGSVKKHTPDSSGYDWNDVLKKRAP